MGADWAGLANKKITRSAGSRQLSRRAGGNGLSPSGQHAQSRTKAPLLAEAYCLAADRLSFTGHPGALHRMR